MKKAKIMLMAIAVVAVTGGVLAFKTNTHLGPGTICITDKDPSGGCDFNCQNANILVNSTAELAGQIDAQFCFTTTVDDFCPEICVLGKNAQP